jgi:hypothetical protein
MEREALKERKKQMKKRDREELKEYKKQMKKQAKRERKERKKHGKPSQSNSRSKKTKGKQGHFSKKQAALDAVRLTGPTFLIYSAYATYAS